MDYLLGRDGLVRRAWRLYLAAVGMVGRGTRAGWTEDEMAVSLAGAIRLPARHRRFSLHGFDVAALDRVARLPRRSLERRRVDQIVSPNTKCHIDLADAPRRRARRWAFHAGMAGASRPGSGFSARIAAGVSTLAMARSARGASGLDSSFVDSELDRVLLACRAAYPGGVGMWPRCSGSAHRRVDLAWAHAFQAN